MTNRFCHSCGHLICSACIDCGDGTMICSVCYRHGLWSYVPGPSPINNDKAKKDNKEKP
mgnify:CR=1 FL=1